MTEGRTCQRDRHARRQGTVTSATEHSVKQETFTSSSSNVVYLSIGTY